MKNNRMVHTDLLGAPFPTNNENETLSQAHVVNADMSFIPDGVSNDWSVQTFEMPKNDFSEMRSLWKTGRYVPAGRYQRLVFKDTLVMSNTPDEIRDFTPFVERAYGSVLINGLGLGCVVQALLSKQEVSRITVIENSEDVIKLVAPHLSDERLTVIHADAFEYTPPKGEKYDFVWHDIWNHICADNLEEMTRLHRKYARKTGWQDSWAKKACQKHARSERYYSF